MLGLSSNQFLVKAKDQTTRQVQPWCPSAHPNKIGEMGHTGISHDIAIALCGDPTYIAVAYPIRCCSFNSTKSIQGTAYASGQQGSE